MRIWLHLLKESLKENFIFCVVFVSSTMGLLAVNYFGKKAPS